MNEVTYVVTIIATDYDQYEEPVGEIELEDMPPNMSFADVLCTAFYAATDK